MCMIVAMKIFAVRGGGEGSKDTLLKQLCMLLTLAISVLTLPSYFLAITINNVFRKIFVLRCGEKDSQFFRMKLGFSVSVEKNWFRETSCCVMSCGVFGMPTDRKVIAVFIKQQKMCMCW